ncbi:lipoic acid synthetase [Anaerovirgula multivorans]|uniref:Lipoyl synthase n=1 Tax=Anaerovirgula multivorans TaxID=312168 RepID=A0A239BS08_9FIRM|nr:lipoyl synthase [Anaerovirgula multivorans]SNS10198.1 lipoic acid synthetase [Anaerovirgula multivorans]
MTIDRKPSWLTKKIPNQKSLYAMENMLKGLSLHTVCEGANCPNIGECFENKTATFMILGKQCTRNCRFCAVSKDSPEELDREEPENVAKAVKELGLKHVVITSVTRDDLKDGGAHHFVHTIKEIRRNNVNTTIEVLIPDFNGNKDALQKIIDVEPEILNHNLETVPFLYKTVRPEGNYKRSLKILEIAKRENPRIITKTGLMLGLGENEEEVTLVMEDLLQVGCDILTLGQYLQPTKKHIQVAEYISPEKFQYYKEKAIKKGLKYVASGPFVRSSYKAIEGYNILSGE